MFLSGKTSALGISTCAVVTLEINFRSTDYHSEGVVVVLFKAIGNSIIDLLAEF